MNKDQIREIFLDAGFEIKSGETDLKPYVYAAAEALLNHQKKDVLADINILSTIIFALAMAGGFDVNKRAPLPPNSIRAKAKATSISDIIDAIGRDWS